MLALDENNPKRGVKKHVLDKLHMVRPLQLSPHSEECMTWRASVSAGLLCSSMFNEAAMPLHEHLGKSLRL